MLLRHAKAVQSARGDDFSRDLTDTGRLQAARVGAFLADKAYVPSFAFVSPSARTAQTFAIVQAAAGRTIPARFDEALFNATATEVRDYLGFVDHDIARLMIIAHNPGIVEAAVALTREGDLVEIIRMRNRFPPCALAILSFDTDDWLDARASGGRLDLLVLPEDLVAPR